MSKYVYNVSDGGLNTKLLTLYDENGHELDKHNMGRVFKNLKSLETMAQETADMLIREIELSKIWNSKA